MASINRAILKQYLDAYKDYLAAQEHIDDARPLSNALEDYKREVAIKAAEVLAPENWDKSQIGTGIIGDKATKAVQRNSNLIGRFQVSQFVDKVRENTSDAEQILYDLYHERKDQDCFERLCGLLGRKYDLIAYLYFILDPGRYLPLRSSIFDDIFGKLSIDLQTAGRCSWDNYQKFLSLVTVVRDEMREYYKINDVDLLDAHSFLWFTKSEAEVIPVKEIVVEVGSKVFHKDYGDGIITKITEAKIYVEFGPKLRVFPLSDAFEKGYLKHV